MNVRYWSVGSRSIWLRPLPLNPGLANATFSRVNPTRTVLRRELLSTEVSVPTVVWSTSDSSRAALVVDCRPCTGMSWLRCGDDSRSQRRPHVWLAFSCWSNRTMVFQTRSSVVAAVLNSGRAGMLTVVPRSIITRSRLKKKCALSLTIGPPIVPPNCVCFVSGFARLFCLAK